MTYIFQISQVWKNRWKWKNPKFIKLLANSKQVNTKGFAPTRSGPCYLCMRLRGISHSWSFRMTSTSLPSSKWMREVRAKRRAVIYRISLRIRINSQSNLCFFCRVNLNSTILLNSNGMPLLCSEKESVKKFAKVLYNAMKRTQSFLEILRDKFSIHSAAIP